MQSMTCLDCGLSFHPDDMGRDGICLSCRKVLERTWAAIDREYLDW